MHAKFLKPLLAGLGFLLSAVSAFAQQNVTISGSSIEDAMVYNNTRSGYEYTRTTNYGSHPRVAAVAWTMEELVCISVPCSGLIYQSSRMAVVVYSAFLILVQYNISPINPGVELPHQR